MWSDFVVRGRLQQGRAGAAAAEDLELKLQNRTALVTGASRGIGALIAEALAERKTNLVLAARNDDLLRSVAERLALYDVTIETIPCDLSTIDGVYTFVAEVGALQAEIDILVNNAGMAAMLPYDGTPIGEILREMQVNLISPLALIRAFLPQMLERRRGHIVNVASLAGEVPLPFEVIYGATKAGLLVASKSLRMEYHGTGVSFSAVLPGVVFDTGMAYRFGEATGMRFPKFMGGCTGKQAARAVVRAIEKDQAEVIVNRPPMRAALALFRLWPQLWESIVCRSPLLQMSKRAANLNLAAGGSHTDIRTDVDPAETKW
jgi:short-subunit dehydrogenase